MNANSRTYLILVAGLVLLVAGAFTYTSAKKTRSTGPSGTTTTLGGAATPTPGFSLLGSGSDVFADAQKLTASDAVRVDPGLSHPVLLEGRDREVYFQAMVSTTRPATSARREPIHLALVIDCSGSMEGEKMAQTKAAARQVVEQLGAQDRFTLVAYESNARVAFPTTPVTAESRERAVRIIENLYPMGSTNISGGMDLALRELTSSPDSDRYVRRVILLSDGQANMGETRNEGLFGRAADLRNRGIGLSAVGVGADYNNALMEGLSEHGGGRLRFLDDASEIATAFMKELQIAATLVAADVKVVLHPAEGVTVEDVYGHLFERSGRDVVIRIPDLAATTQIRVLARLSVDARRAELPVVEAAATYVEVGADRPRAVTRASALSVRTTSDQELVNRQIDRSLLAFALNGKSIAEARKAMELYEAGKREEALAAIDRVRTDMQAANQDLKSETLTSSFSVMGNLRSLFASSANALGGEASNANVSAAGGGRSGVQIQRKAIRNFGSNNSVKE